MEDVIGYRTDDRLFAAFLRSWRAVLDSRVDEVRERLASVSGLESAVLAGGIGRGEPWPLSDIDILPIFAPGAEPAARAEIAPIVAELESRWASEGWYGGIDLGMIAFDADEVEQAVDGRRTVLDLLGDPHWYHAIDKGYRGRSLSDRDDDRAGRLARWLTDHRFRLDIVRYRIDHAVREGEAAQAVAGAAADAGDLRAATLALWKAIQWWQIGLMESWGQRDNSLGRFGTRFRRAASERGLDDLADDLDRFAGLDDGHLMRRMREAPWWVWQRHERSLAARRAVGEHVSVRDDQRDTLRVSAMYAARRHPADTTSFPAWLGIVPTHTELSARIERLRSVIGVTAAKLIWPMGRVHL